MKPVKDDLLTELNSKYDRGIQNKLDAEQNALVNINFINGKQYIKYNKELNVIEELQPENSNEYRETEVFNKLRTLRTTVLTQVQDKMPMPQALPYTQDDEDLDTAKATNAMLSDLYNRQKIAKKLKQAATDCVDIGPAFLHVKWDPKAGTIMMSDFDALLGDQSQLIPYEEKLKLKAKLDSKGTLRSGDVVVEFVRMFEIVVADPFEQDLQEQPWMMRIKSYPVEEAEKLFGKTFETTESAGRITVGTDKYSRYINTLTNNLGVHNTEKTDRVVVVKEYFEKPSALRENGRYVLFAGEHILKDTDLPYINGEYETRIYPFVKIGLDTPNLFYSHAFIEDMKAVQRRYNQIRNRKFEYITKNVHGQIAVEVGSMDDEAEISNKPGSVIWYNRGFTPPQMLKSNSTGTLDVDSELNSLDNEFVGIVGISTLSTQGTPNTSAVRGASMVQTLLESDNSKFSLITNALIDAVIELSKQSVRLYKQFMLPQEVRFTRFTKDIATVVNWHRDLLVEDIDIKDKQKLSTTDSRRKQDIQQMLQMGLLSPQLGLGPELTVKLLEQLDMGVSVNELPIPGYPDIKKARRENRLIVNNGAQIDADDIDDHGVHMSIHSDFMKSDEFRRLVIMNPQVDALMRQHVSQHNEVVSKQQQAAQAEAIAQQNLKNK